MCDVVVCIYTWFSITRETKLFVVDSELIDLKQLLIVLKHSTEKRSQNRLTTCTVRGRKSALYLSTGRILCTVIEE